MNNIGNFLNSNIRKHNRSNRLNKHIDKRFKLYWSRSTASGSGCGIIQIKPKAAGQKLYIVVGNGGDNTNFGNGSLPAPTHDGAASGVGTLPDLFLSHLKEIYNKLVLHLIQVKLVMVQKLLVIHQVVLIQHCGQISK